MICQQAEVPCLFLRHDGPINIELFRHVREAPDDDTEVYLSQVGIVKGLASSVTTEDVPRLVKCGEKADSEETKELLQTYKTEGTKLFERIAENSSRAWW